MHNNVDARELQSEQETRGTVEFQLQWSFLSPRKGHIIPKHVCVTNYY